LPELPEVEIHTRNLRRWLEGRRIREYAILDPKLEPEGGSGAWQAALAGKRVIAVRRVAKYLLADLEGGNTLVTHLRMTGRFVRVGYRAGDPEKHTRLVLGLEDGEEVHFRDARRFGRVWVTPTESVRELPELAALGPDALLEPSSADRLRELFRGSRRPIKVLLLDQRLIGGIGNICAIEILYRAGIAPETPANALAEEQVEAIARTIPEFLEWAIARQSRRELIYLGERGAENVFRIYRRAGSTCPRCGEKIVRTVLGGRGTFSCPGCQK
jgi:formamidopyrimidine-DNA glycosylase